MVSVQKKISPLLFLSLLCFTAGILLTLYQHTGSAKDKSIQTKTKPQQKVSVQKEASTKDSAKEKNKKQETAAVSDTNISPVHVASGNVLGSSISPTKAVSATQQTQQTPLFTTVPTATQTPTPTKAPSVTLQLNEPDGNFSFILSYHTGSNPCSIVNDAKNEGRVRSVTIIHYGAPLNSDYVKEINGYQDNWNFALNGETKPTGCSNYALTIGDTVSWKYN